MARTADVVLDAEARPEWPAFCPCCDAASPAGRMVVEGIRHSFLSMLWPLLLLFAKRRKFEVPACASCRRRESRRFWLRVLALLGPLVVSAALLLPLLQQLPKPLRKFAFVAIALPAFAPYVWLYFRWPPAVAVTVGKTSNTFEFRSRDYALRFAVANARALHRGRGSEA